MWSRGDAVVLRYVHDGKVSRVLPVTVVEDSDRAVSLFFRPRTRVMTRCGPDGEPISRSLPYAERFSRPWTLGESSWDGSHMLLVTPVGAAYSFWAIWDEDWAFGVWYVNVQEPLRRTRFGFDTTDNVLDVVIEPDLSSWRWKDEHELDEAIRLGRFTTAEAAAVRAAGRRAVEVLDAREWPFDRDWSGWRPDPAWPRPDLPADPAAYEP